MKEWRDIVGYEGLYKVSSDGEILSLNTYSHKKPKLMKLGKHGGGYLVVSLSKNGVTKTVLVHRIVAQAFIQNPNNYDFVNHKDENKANNRVENLEWCTKSYNTIYYLNFDESRKVEYGNRFRNKQTGESLSPWVKRNPHTYFEKIVQKDLNGNVIREFDNAVQAYMSFGIKSDGNIISVCKKNKERKGTEKKPRTYKGYVWEFSEIDAVTKT